VIPIQKWQMWMKRHWRIAVTTLVIIIMTAIIPPRPVPIAGESMYGIGFPDPFISWRASYWWESRDLSPQPLVNFNVIQLIINFALVFLVIWLASKIITAIVKIYRNSNLK